MSFAQTLSTYITLNLLVAVGFIGLRLLRLATRGKGLTAAADLKLHYAIVTAIGVITLSHPFLPRNEVFRPAAKVWSAQSIRSFPIEYTAPDQGGYLMVPTLSGNYSIHTDKVSIALAIIALLVTTAGLFRFARDMYALARIRRRSFGIRKIGAVTIFMNDDIQVPFSSWLPGRADVVIPSPFLSRHQDYQMAVAHELQHHRQGDTRWVYAMWALKVLCAANPCVYLWNRWISELQEFACDETLVDQNKVESQQYARCLVEVAETANGQRYVPACATGLIFLIERNLLQRRIERMINVNSAKRGRSIGLAIGLTIASLMAGVAYASSGFVQDRRVSMADAQRLAVKAQQGTEFPVIVNDLVLKQLNRYIGTPEGREFMRNALQRMDGHRFIIEGKIKAYRVPSELIAIPIAEAGYRNLTEAESNTHGRAAGLWQFISSTARNFGLRVDAQRDERLDVSLSTDAALRYLQSNKLRFNDWNLSVLAYNMGEGAVQKGINATGSRDAWTLIRSGYEGDKDYLPRLMAAILIMRNPESVE